MAVLPCRLGGRGSQSLTGLLCSSLVPGHPWPSEMGPVLMECSVWLSVSDIAPLPPPKQAVGQQPGQALREVNHQRKSDTLKDKGSVVLPVGSGYCGGSVICSSFWTWCYGEGKEVLNFGADVGWLNTAVGGCREPRCFWVLTWWQRI